MGAMERAVPEVTGSRGRRVQTTVAFVPEANGGRPLPDDVREPMERQFGQCFESIRIHEDARVTDLGARALARGEHLHFGSNRFMPKTDDGRALLAHELTHVLQQRAGRVRGRPGGAPMISMARSLEREADQNWAGVPLATTAPDIGVVQADWTDIDGKVHPGNPPAGYELQNDNIRGPYFVPSTQPSFDPATEGAEVTKRQRRMRRVLNDEDDPAVPEPDNAPLAKFAFPFDALGEPQLFQNGQPVGTREHTVKLKGGVTHTAKLPPDPAPTTTRRVLPRLPRTIRHDGALARLMTTPDPATGGDGHDIDLDGAREATVGYLYGRHVGLLPETVDRVPITMGADGKQDASPDFQGRLPDGSLHRFDPFVSPRPDALSDDTLVKLDAHHRDILGKNPDRGPNPQAVVAQRKKWAKGAYREHTDGKTKGAGVVGVWDQSSDTQAEIDALSPLAEQENPGDRLVSPFDANLDREFALEDYLAAKELEPELKRQREDEAYALEVGGGAETQARALEELAPVIKRHRDEQQRK